MAWMLLAISGVALIAYFGPYALLERLAWRARPGEVRLETVPYWSVEKAYERWRLGAFVVREGIEASRCGAFPFPSDNIFETLDDANRALQRIASHSPSGLLVAEPFFWIQCVEPSITGRARTTALIGLATGVALLAAAGLVAVL